MNQRERASIGPLALKQVGTVEHAYQMLEVLKMMFQSKETSVRRWQETLDMVEEHRVYDLVPPEQPYGSIDTLLAAEIGAGKAESVQVVKGYADAAKALAEHGGDRKTLQHQGNNITLMLRGTSADYLTARIARDRPDILERMKTGEFSSVRQAGIEAGFIKKTVQLHTTPEAFARAAEKHLTRDQIEHLIGALVAQLETGDGA